MSVEQELIMLILAFGSAGFMFLLGMFVGARLEIMNAMRLLRHIQTSCYTVENGVDAIKCELRASKGEAK